MTCKGETWKCLDCDTMLTGNRARKRCPPCGKARHTNASYVAKSSALSPWHCESPDRPEGMTEAEARARKYRIALEMLREGWPTSAVMERFSESALNLTELARKHGLKLGGEVQLPGGLPA